MLSSILINLHRKESLLFQNLTRHAQLKDDKGKPMPAMTVFSEGIRYLRDHLIQTCEEKNAGLEPDEVHWVLTVPAIWDDSAKQFMREAAIEAGIDTKRLSLALEPEAASLFCRYLPVQKVRGEDGMSQIKSLAPGKRYLVLDAGGGTVDITVHETLEDGTVKEIYKANGGPWGGTKIDEAFLDFLVDVAGQDTIEIFMKDFKDDYLTLLREFEIKKKTFGSESTQEKITFRIPLSVHETYQRIYGNDFRQSLMLRQDLQGQITFSGDKLRVGAQEVEKFFQETCGKIVEHLRNIFSRPAVTGTETILMVGGFSESKMLQRYIKSNFPEKKFVIPEEAGLAVVKGAVIFGHNPRAIVSRIVKHTYGVRTRRKFIPGVHPVSKRSVCDGKVRCKDCFSIHVREGQEVVVGTELDAKHYHPIYKDQTHINFKIYTSTNRDPVYTDERGCSYLGNLEVDLSDIKVFLEKEVAVKMIYGDTELGVAATVLKTGVTLNAKLNFLG